MVIINEDLIDKILTNLNDRNKAQGKYRELIQQLINVVFLYESRYPAMTDSLKETLFDTTGKTWVEIMKLKEPWRD